MNRKGFSVIEVMVVAAIIGILAVVAIPNFQVWINNQRLRTHISQLEGDLQLSRMTAIGQSAPVRVQFNAPAPNQYNAFIDFDRSGGMNGAEALLFQKTLVDGVVFSLVSPTIAFNGRGLRTAPAPGNATIELQNLESKKYCLNVTMMGDVNVSYAAC
jgi:prepilin-type N-terminal cleavage/methylation domain-containing protein